MCEIMERLAAEEREAGIEQINKLHSILIDLNRIDDLKRATKDKEFQKYLITELLSEEA